MSEQAVSGIEFTILLLAVLFFIGVVVYVLMNRHKLKPTSGKKAQEQQPRQRRSQKQAADNSGADVEVNPGSKTNNVEQSPRVVRPEDLSDEDYLQYTRLRRQAQRAASQVDPDEEMYAASGGPRLLWELRSKMWGIIAILAALIVRFGFGITVNILDGDFRLHGAWFTVTTLIWVVASILGKGKSVAGAVNLLFVILGFLIWLF